MIVHEDISEEWENPFDLELSRIIIPLSDFFIKREKTDIYTGQENLPFNQKDPEYRNILLSEFLQ